MSQPRGWTSYLFASLRGYQPAWLMGDVLAALTLAAIAFPEQLATAHLVGLPPMTGILAFAAGTLAIAALGASRIMSVGADSTIAPIMATAVAGMAAAGSAQYAGLLASLALLVGVILLLTRPLRLGWVADLLSIPVATGVLAGIAIHIIVGQLPDILGVAPPAGILISRLGRILQHLADTNPYSLAIGLGVLVVSLLGERLNRLVPGPLIGLVLGGLAVWYWDLARTGVEVVGALHVTAPRLALALPSWHQFTDLLPLSFLVALVCMMQTAVVTKSMSAGGAEPESVTRDFAAIGAGSILASVMGAFAVDSSPPRTQVVAGSGGHSQLSGLLAVGVIIVVAFLATDAFALVPRAALGGVLVFIASRIFQVRVLYRIYRQSLEEFLLAVASAVLVVVLPLEQGVGMGIALSLLYSIYGIARPRCKELARVPGTTIWWTHRKGEVGDYEPGVLVYAFEAPLNFINAEYIVGQLMGAVAAKTPPCRLVVIEANGVASIDYTGSQTLQAAIKDLRGRGITVALARLESDRAKEAAASTGLIDAIGADHIFLSVDEAIHALVPGA